MLFSVFSLFESHAKHLAHHVPASVLLQFEVEKPGLHPFRLLAMVSLAWLGWRHIPAGAAWLRSRWAGMLVLLGQHSLVVFAASVVFAVLGEAILWTHPRPEDAGAGAGSGQPGDGGRSRGRRLDGQTGTAQGSSCRRK